VANKYKDLLEIIDGPGSDWIVVLAPFTTKTQRTGRAPLLVEFSQDQDEEYYGYTLKGVRAAIAYIRENERLGRYPRQHMYPGVKEGYQGQGFGTVMYLCGSIQADVNGIEASCTVSPTESASQRCEDAGPPPNPDAMKWWEKAVDKGVASVEPLTCFGGVTCVMEYEIPDEGEGGFTDALDYSFREDFEWSEAVIGSKVGLRRSTRVRPDSRFIRTDMLSVLVEETEEEEEEEEEEEYAISITGREIEWTPPEPDNYELAGIVGDDEDNPFAILGMDLRADTLDFQDVEILPGRYRVEIQGSAELAVNGEGKVTNVLDLQLGLTEYKLLRKPSVKFTVIARGTANAEANLLCGVDVLEEQNLVLAQSKNLDTWVAPAEVFAQMSLDTVSTEVLGKLLDLRGDAELAVEALESSIFNEGAESQRKLQILREDLGGQLRLRLDNPGLDFDLIDQLYEEALDFGELADVEGD
jgi:hypothetical protein